MAVCVSGGQSRTCQLLLLLLVTVALSLPALTHGARIGNGLHLWPLQMPLSSEKAGPGGARSHGWLHDLSASSQMKAVVPIPSADDGPDLPPMQGTRGVCFSRNASRLAMGTPRMPSMWWSNTLEGGARIQLRSRWLKWLVPRAGPNHSLAADLQQEPPPTEYFVVRRGRDAKISLEAPNGGQVAVTDAGHVKILHNALPDQSLFHVKQGGDNQIQLKSTSGHWLCASEDGFLSWSSGASELETFDVREVKEVPAMRGVNLGGWLVIEGWIKMSLFEGVPELVDGAQLQLQSVALGCWLLAEWGGGGDISCLHTDSPGSWETFHLRREDPDSPDGGVQLRSANRFFLTAKETNGNELAADVWADPSPTGPCTFRLVASPGDSSIVNFQAKSGKFLTIDSTGTLAFNADSADWSGPTAFRVVAVGGLMGEWQLGAGLGPDKAFERLEKHRETWVTKADFAYLADNHINLARIPVGYWITQGDHPDGAFVRGGLRHLDNAFRWGNTYGIRIMIDLHGAPGSQNGLQETGSRDGFADFSRSGSGNMDKAVEAIDFLAERYANDGALFAIELLNEPALYSTPFDFMTQYYEEGYRRVRKHSSCVYVVLSSRWMGKDTELMSILNGPNYNNVIMDFHWYGYYLTGVTNDYIINTWYTEKTELLKQLGEGGRLWFGGEWSVGLPTATPATEEEHYKFGLAQLEVYTRYAKAGWAFWTYKLDGFNPPWNFRESRAHGWLPYESIDAKIAREQEDEAFKPVMSASWSS